MLELSATFYVSPTTDVAALAKVLQSLAQLVGPAVVIHGSGGQLSAPSAPKPAAPLVPEPVEVDDVPAADATGAPVLPGPGAEQPRKRGRPKKGETVPPPPGVTVVQGVPAEPAHAATPPPPAPAAQPKVVTVPTTVAPTPAKSEADIERELFGGAPADDRPATLADLQEAMRAFITKNGANKAQEVFQAHGFARLSEVPADKFRALVNALKV